MESTNTTNFTEADFYEAASFTAHQVLFTIFAIVGIVADSLIIYCMFHYERLHTVANVFLANWAIADLISLIVTPTAYRILPWHTNLPLAEEFFCFLFDSGSIFHAGTVLFALLVAIDWIVSAYFRQASSKFRGPYKYLISLVWAIIVLLLVTSVGICCTSGHNPHFIRFLFFFVLVAILFVFLVQTMRLVQKLRGRPADVASLSINLVTAYLCCWIFTIFNVIISMGYIHRPLLEFVSMVFLFSSSIVNFGLLYFFNRDFQASVLETFTCKRGSVNEVRGNSVTFKPNEDF